jgi:hypothetical protein
MTGSAEGPVTGISTGGGVAVGVSVAGLVVGDAGKGGGPHAEIKVSIVNRMTVDFKSLNSMFLLLFLLAEHTNKLTYQRNIKLSI